MRYGLGALAISITVACSSISTVRVQPESLAVGPHLRPIAIIHAQVTSAYLLFFPIPGGVDLDHVVNRMLFAAAKTLGADKVVDVRVDITPDDGIWTLRKILGWRSAEASGIAVMIDDTAPAASPAANAPPASVPPAGAAPASAPGPGK